jgi:Flp pilus assembly protein TadG
MHPTRDGLLDRLMRTWRAPRSRAGNVAIITCLVAVPLVFAAGMGVDYTLANRRQDQINGFADAAALAAVTPNMMNQSSETAQAAARSMFNSQLATVSSVAYSPSNIVVNVTDTANGTAVNRVVSVRYTALSNNAFSAVLGMAAIPIGGGSSATSYVAPRIDFYMLLDTSPSMAIAATQAGINTMVANTASQGGCAFGCHETYPAADNLGNPGGEDNYALARSLGVPLRMDLVSSATQNLMNTAPTIAAQNHTTYRAAIYTMDYATTQLSPLTGDFAALTAAAANVQTLVVYDNNCLTQTNCNNDEDSYLDDRALDVNSAMPTPGNGTSNAGDTPQEVLFIVSDGVVDELHNGSRVIAPAGATVDWCTTVKNRGIRIAYLYLTYYPLPTNSFYTAHVAPFQPNLSADMRACASPGLFFEVSTGGDVNAAMQALFKKAVATAHLTQ